MRRRRVKKWVFVIPCIIIIAIILVIIGINYYKKINSYEYKLEKVGYNTSEVEKILKLDTKYIDNLLTREYNKVIPKFISKDHFIYDNLDRYLAYYKGHEKVDKAHIVALVNVNCDNKFYTNTTKTDEAKDNLILVNKYNYLTKDYKIDDLVDVSILYMYGKQKMRKEAYNKFIELFNAAKKDNITIIINSSYRTYEYQKNLWQSYANGHGEEWADSYAARAGYSEHETGLAIDVTTYGVKEQEDFEKTDAYKWMQENAHKYGFILRYPKGKEGITGYNYEPWHYRYVGVDTATKVYESGLTYDEYYTYYIKK